MHRPQSAKVSNIIVVSKSSPVASKSPYAIPFLKKKSKSNAICSKQGASTLKKDKIINTKIRPQTSLSRTVNPGTVCIEPLALYGSTAQVPMATATAPLTNSDNLPKDTVMVSILPEALLDLKASTIANWKRTNKRPLLQITFGEQTKSGHFTSCIGNVAIWGRKPLEFTFKKGEFDAKAKSIVSMKVGTYQNKTFKVMYSSEKSKTIQFGERLLCNMKAKKTNACKLRFTAKKLGPASPEKPLTPEAPPKRFLFGGNLSSQLSSIKNSLRPANRKVHPIVTLNDGPPEEQLIAAFDAMRVQVEKMTDTIDAQNIQVLSQIGEGLFAAVKHAQIAGSDIAVKEFRYKTPASEHVLNTFQAECEVLAKLQHSHIINMTGVCFTPTMAIVMEYMNGGSLYHYMLRENWKDVILQEKIRIACDIACGIQFMHDQQIIHRDLKSHNILVHIEETGKATAKVGDLGSCINVVQGPVQGQVGTSGYVAPEVLKEDSYSYPADVWSFGILLWEIVAAGTSQHRNPYTGLSVEQFLEKAKSSLRPTFPPDIDTTIPRLVEDCLQYAPENRISIQEILERLQTLCT